MKRTPARPRAVSRSRWIAPLTLLGMLASALMFPAVASAATPITKSFTANGDSYVSTREPGITHGARTSAYATRDETHAFLVFPTKGLVPSGYTITGVQLKVLVRENNRHAGAPVVSIAENSWNENTLVLGNRPVARNFVVSSPVSAPVGQWVTIPLSATRAINPDDYSSFEVWYNTDFSNFRFDTKESGNAPQLVVTMAPTSSGSAPAPAPAPAPGPVSPTAPAPAAAAGYGRMVFGDDFNTLDSIDLTGTGVAGKKWYTDRPFGHPQLKPSDLSVSNGVLTLNQSDDNLNVGLTSVSARSKQGSAYQYGYYEARVAFDPANATRSRSYPSFWTLSRDHVENPSGKQNYAEFGIFEAFHDDYKAYQNMFVGTIHDWFPWVRYMNGGNNTYKLDGVNFNEFHTYSALWTPGRVTWYFDGRQVLTQSYGANQVPSPNYANLPYGTFKSLDAETRGMALILGTGSNNPMRVDYVRVWR